MASGGRAWLLIGPRGEAEGKCDGGSVDGGVDVDVGVDVDGEMVRW